MEADAPKPKSEANRRGAGADSATRAHEVSEAARPNSPLLSKKINMEVNNINQLFALIDSWDATNVQLAATIIKGNRDFAAAVNARYNGLITKGLGGKKLEILADLPTKWEKMKADKRALVIENYPQDLPFFTKTVDLSGDLRVDTWRDSHYKYQIGTLTKAIGRLKNVEVLRLQHQQLKELPAEIGEMSALQVLDLTDNKLRQLPESLYNLRELRELNLTQNYGLVQVLDFANWQKLELIDFTYTNIKELGESFFALPKLRKIVTVNSDLDKEIAILKRIKTAFPDAILDTYARDALAREARADMDEYKGKETIKIDDWHINHLPVSLFAADVVKELEISCYALKELPDLFGQLPTLEKLKLQVGNQITELPKSVCALSNLKSLTIEHSHISALPDDFGQLAKLEELYLDCQLRALPASFGQLGALRKLYLDCSPLVDYWPILAALPALAELTLKNPAIYEEKEFLLPSSLAAMQSLTRLEIESRGYWTDAATLRLPPNLKKFDLRQDVWKAERRPLSLANFFNHLPLLEELRIRGEMDFSGDEIAINPHAHLRTLHLDNAQLLRFPPTFGALGQLKEATFFSVGREEFGAEIYECSQLEHMRMSGSKFTTIADGIEKLQKMRWFGFERQTLTTLPDGIFELKLLEKLCFPQCPAPLKAKLKRQIKGLKIVKEWYG